MSFEQKEEFIGIGDINVNLRCQAWWGLLFELGFGLTFLTMRC